MPLTRYPLPSRCWCCGRFVSGSHDYAHRSCRPCDVTWHELLPGMNVTHRQDPEGQQLLLSAKWPMRMHAGYADQFDRLINHAMGSISTPA